MKRFICFVLTVVFILYLASCKEDYGEQVGDDIALSGFNGLSEITVRVYNKYKIGIYYIDSTESYSDAGGEMLIQTIDTSYVSKLDVISNYIGVEDLNGDGYQDFYFATDSVFYQDSMVSYPCSVWLWETDSSTFGGHLVYNSEASKFSDVEPDLKGFLGYKIGKNEKRVQYSCYWKNNKFISVENKFE